VEGARTPPALVLVYANWCPHCYPLSTDRAPELARRLGVPLRLLDIDVPDQEKEADAMVERHGDWDPNYLIPQLFFDHGDGVVEHLLTGVPGSLAGTRKAWDRLFERFPVAPTTRA
jgi:thiol-disulfide isomerase/thioredoxin